VEAAHIVPHRFYGKDDIWNGIALCRFHHWSFDVGWFTLREDFTVEVNDRIQTVPLEEGFMGGFDVLRQLIRPNQRIGLPQDNALFPHENSISWHRRNIFTAKS
jgi:putative restriction endonuclease